MNYIYPCFNLQTYYISLIHFHKLPYKYKGNEHNQMKTIEKTMNIEESFKKTFIKTIKTNDTLKKQLKKKQTMVSKSLFNYIKNYLKPLYFFCFLNVFAKFYCFLFVFQWFSLIFSKNNSQP